MRCAMKTVFMIGLVVAALLMATRPHQSESRPDGVRATPSYRVADRIRSAPVAATAELADEIRRRLDSSDQEWVFTNGLSALISLDPSAAARLLEDLEHGPLREEFLRRLAQGWGVQDSSAALAWASGLAIREERDAALVDVCLHMAQADPLEALWRARDLLPGEQHYWVRESLLQQWAEKDLSAALAWANAYPPGEQREKVLARIALVQSQSAPADAAQLVATEIPPGDVQAEAAMSVLHQWAMRDWPAAAAWLAQFSDGPLRERAERELAGIAAYAEGSKQQDL